jgi:4-amino-4-deoxy-L-arabinose transferase-like glycosyltransferase
MPSAEKPELQTTKTITQKDDEIAMEALKEDLEFLEPDNTSASNPEAIFWNWSTIFCLLSLAFVVRLAFLFLLKTYQFDRIDDSCISGETTNIAMSITGGHGFHSPFNGVDTGPTSWIAPAYPYFVAFVFRFFGVLSKTSIIIILVVQSVFSALTIIPILGIAERTVGRRAGLWAAWMWCLFPWFSKWSVTWVWDISLSALLGSLLLWFALALPELPSRKSWIGFGALWGFALLVNPALSTFLAVSLAWCGFELYRRDKSWLAPIVFAVLACAVVISPWLIRNRVVFGEWVFLRGNFGYEFALGNYHASLGRGWGGPHPSGNQKEFKKYWQMGEVAYIRSKQEQAIQFVKNSPREFWELTARRVGYFWDGSAMNYSSSIRWYWVPSSFWVVSFLLLPALFVTHRNQLHAWQMFLGILLLYPLPYYLTYSQVRYRHALEPIILLLICYAGVEAESKLSSAFRSIYRRAQ